MAPITWQQVVTLIERQMGLLIDYTLNDPIPRLFVNPVFLVLMDAEVQSLASREQQQLAILMFDAVRYTKTDALSKEQIEALQTCASYLGSASITNVILARCDETLLNAGLDSLPDTPDEGD